MTCLYKNIALYDLWILKKTASLIIFINLLKIDSNNE